jgi:glycosyltransferase involved in cell wall biosynthesis
MSGRPTVLHVVEAFGGGVQSALAHFIESAPFINHVVLGRVREGEGTEGPAADIVLYEGGFLGFAAEMRRLARLRRPDVVHMHSSKAGLLRPAVPSGIRRVYSPHCYAFERKDVSGPFKLGIKAAERALARVTDAVVAVSPHEAALATSMAGAAGVFLVSNLAPIASFHPNGSTEKRVVTIGRIAPQKAPSMYAEIAEASPTDIRFVWVGDGDPALRRRLESAGVRVTGWLDPAGVQEELKHASLYLHTAAWEASPMSLAQALAAGVPIICRSLGTLRSLGYFCVEGSSGVLADSVEAFFDDAVFAKRVRDGADTAIATLMQVNTTDGLRQAYMAPEARPKP